MPPITAPSPAETRITNGSTCQPVHAPIAARSLKSPKPMPSLPARRRKAPVHEPEDHVAGGRAEHRRAQVHEDAEGVREQPQPQQRQRDVVGQELGVEVDEGERDHRPGEDEGATSAAE
jgi:hypothetical protein